MDSNPMATLPKTPIPDTQRGEGASPKDQATWLLGKIDTSIDYVHNQRDRFQRLAGSIRVGTLILSALVTALLGIRWQAYSGLLRNVAFIVGTLTTTLASLDLYFNYRSLWVEHEEAEWRLQRLKDRIGFYLEGRKPEEIDGTVMAKYHESYQWIWDHLSTNWLALRRSTHSGK
jgi:hypothetical protein